MTFETRTVDLTDQHGPILVGTPNDRAMDAWHRGCEPVRPANDTFAEEPLTLFSAAGNDW